MFREMRRKGQMLSLEESKSILDKMTSGVLAVLGDDDYPYAVPISYVCQGDKIYFHSALSGHKIDAVRKCDKASFCVVDKDEIIPEKYTTYYRSVIAFGKIRIIDNDSDKLKAIDLLAKKYSPEEEGRSAEITKNINRMLLLELTIEHITGKEAIELARQKRNS